MLLLMMMMMRGNDGVDVEEEEEDDDDDDDVEAEDVDEEDRSQDREAHFVGPWAVDMYMDIWEEPKSPCFAWKFTGKVLYANPATPVLHEPIRRRNACGHLGRAILHRNLQE